MVKPSTVMQQHQPPDIDLRSLCENVMRLPEVESASLVDGGVEVRLEDRTLYVFQDVGSDTDADGILEDADDVLIAVWNGFLEFRDGSTLLYSFSKSRTHELLLEEIIQGEIDPEELGEEEIQDCLAESGYIHGYIPGQVAEIMVSWAVSSPEDSILDIATGTGTLLKQAGNAVNTDSHSINLVGIEIHPLIAKVARSRIRGVKTAEVVNADFFDWRFSDQRDLEDVDETGGGASPEGIPEQFDAIVGNPPAGMLHNIAPEKRDQIRELLPGARRSASAAFVAKAVTHLKDGGRGAFVLPRSALNEGLLEHLTESCSIQRIVELPIETFPDDSSVQMVILTLIKEQRDSDLRQTGIAKFNQQELPENARGLFEQPLEEIVSNRYNPYNVEMAVVSHTDLSGSKVLRILSNPPIYDIIRSDRFTKLGDLAEITVGTGVTTGDNDFFHFDLEQKEESDIDDRFFRPLIKNPSSETGRITAEDIDLFLLDLYPYVQELEEKGIEITESSVLEHLEDEGQEEVVDYLQDKSEEPNHPGLRFLPRYRGSIGKPDLVIPELFDDPRCYTVEVEDAMIDSTMFGFEIENERTRDPLARLLNTPLYKEFFQTFSRQFKLDWYRINVGQIRDIPIIVNALSQSVYERMDPFFPPEDDNDLIRLNHILIESCEGDEERQALRRYLASRDDYAWSWLLTLPELEEFEELLESDREEARQFVLERFDPEYLDQARKTFDNIEFFERRRELLNDLLMEFEEGHYRGFLAGIVLQFEGILSDLVVEAGGEIIEENGETKFELPGEGQGRKSLDGLISAFFDGVFSAFLHETVRQRRNQIAHGDVIEDNRELAVHFFISFYALCNASLSQYVRIAEEQPVMS